MLQQDEDQLFGELTTRAVTTLSLMQFAFDTELFLPHRIDEISLLFKHQGQLERYAEWLVAKGGEHFNARVLDRMFREKQQAETAEMWFDVQFEFMHLPGHQTWRIEAMTVTDGHAPLHEHALAGSGGPCVFHASFKADGPEAYAVAERQLAKARLRRLYGYRNAYGRFSYWQGLRNVYVKPRINTRDA